MNVPINRLTLAKYVICACICGHLFFYGAYIEASPWIEPGDERTRHHLQYLSDTGIIKTPLTTWPLPWAAIELELDYVSLEQMSHAQLWSFRYLKHQLQYAQKRFKSQKRFHTSNSAVPFTHFASDTKEQTETSSQSTLLLNNVAFNLEAHIVRDQIEGTRSRLDGSFIAATLGNWIVGAGAIERWWGPAWQSSLILSNNARPSTGIFIKRKEPAKSELPVLSWLGMWNMEIFANQLKDERQVSDTTLTGLRVSASPIRNIEISYSRLGLTGGDKPSTAAESPNKQTTNNHLTSIDTRAHANFRNVNIAVYGQYLRNEKHIDSKAEDASLIGIESGFSFAHIHNRIAAELSDTENSTLDNAIYDHPIYGSGYRHYNKPFGESAGTNAKKISLLGDHYLSNGMQISWRLSEVKINERHSSNNVYSNQFLEQTLVELFFKYPINNVALINLGAFGFDNKMKIAEDNISSGGYLQLEFRF